MSFSCRVHGHPIAQGRPRACRAGGIIRVYDPATSRDWKRTVQSQVLAAWPSHRPPLDEALILRLVFYLPRPKSLPRRVLHHTKKPDLDNLAKAVKDAIRGIVYRDDSIVVELHVTKRYGDRPGVEIFVSPYEVAMFSEPAAAAAAEEVVG